MPLDKLGPGDIISVFAKAEDMLENGDTTPSNALHDALHTTFPSLDISRSSAVENLQAVLNAAASVIRAMIHSLPI